MLVLECGNGCVHSDPVVVSFLPEHYFFKRKSEPDGCSGTFNNILNVHMTTR